MPLLKARSPSLVSASSRPNASTTTIATRRVVGSSLDARSRAGGERCEQRFDGLVTAEAAQPSRKVLAAQEKGAIGVIFVEDVHNQTTPSNFQAQAAAYWPPTAPRVERYTLKAWADKVRIPVVQVSAAVAERLLAGTGRPLVELARTAETRGGVAPVPINTVDRHESERRPSHGPRPQHCRHARRQRSGAQKRARAGQCALRSRRSGRAADLQRRR